MKSKLKKIMALTLALVFCLSVFVGCKSEKDEKGEKDETDEMGEMGETVETGDDDTTKNDAPLTEEDTKDYGLSFELNDTVDGYILVDVLDTDKEEIVIPEKIDNLPVVGIQCSFEHCGKLESISIPDSIVAVDEHAFSDCRRLKYNEFDNAIYLGNENNPYVLLVQAKDDGITSCEINSKTKVIGDSAFYWCNGLKNIVVPNSVRTIGQYTFSGCSVLTSIVIPESVTTVGKSAFVGCYALQSIVIPKNVTTIGVRLFLNCSALTSIDIPSSVTKIEDGAFSGCSALKSITLSNSVKSIGDDPFERCKSVKSVTFSGTKSELLTLCKDNTWYEDFSNDCIFTCNDGTLTKNELSK